MKAEDVFTTDNLRAIRPGYGLAPKFIDLFLGRQIQVDVRKGAPLDLRLI